MRPDHRVRHGASLDDGRHGRLVQDVEADGLARRMDAGVLLAL
jgi:hypothetical protein